MEVDMSNASTMIDKEEIEMNGPLDVRNVARLKNKLYDSLNGSVKVVFKAEGEELSFAGLQLLCSGCRSVGHNRKRFDLQGNHVRLLREAARIAGFPSKECRAGNISCCLTG
jgi:hypothetical protein